MTLNNNEIYDVGIVGAGPGGATAAYYLAKKGYNVLLIEKKKFPRNKICGDAITLRAQEHLKEMGVLQEILAEKKGNWAALGGIVSPGGIEYLGDSHHVLNSHLVIAIKREIMDEKVARAAQKAGANLLEEYTVDNASFSLKDGYWTIITENESKPSLKAKVLICADGAASHLAKKLGLLDTFPQATSSSAYIKAGSHNYKQDGVCYYPPKLVPGYCALFKEADGDLVYCCYIIPGGKVTNSDLMELHHTFIKEDPFISKAVGPNIEIEKMKAGPIRFGGIKKSYSDHLLIVGDAAGQIDPLTGEGIQYAMDAGKYAADTLDEAFKKNNLSKNMMKKYHKKWMKEFGKDFKWSLRMAKYLANHPIFLDAFASLCKRKGDDFMAEWGKIMTGSKAKINFFLPNLAIPLLNEVFRLRLKKSKK